MPADSDRLARIGRIQLSLLFVYLLLTSLGLLLWRTEGDISSFEFMDGLRFLIEIGLFVFVWCGYRWAKWTTVFLLFAAAVWAAFRAQSPLRPEELRVILIGLSVFYGFIGLGLVASRSINAHLDHQRLLR